MTGSQVAGQPAADRLPGDSPWPTTTSVGRWLHAVARDLTDDRA